MANKILIVDDADLSREKLAKIMSTEYEVIQAANGVQAIGELKKYGEEICAVILDVVMPEMDGFAVLFRMQAAGFLETIPVIFMSESYTPEMETKGFEMGVSDFVRKPFNAFIVRKRVKNVVQLYEFRRQMQAKVKEQKNMIQSQYKMLQQQAEKLQENNSNIIEALGSIVEYRNLESGNHIKRVKGFTQILARQLMEDYPEYHITEEKIAVITAASALHDVGKVAIPDNILLKPGKYTPEEFEYMKSHTTRGCDLLDSIGNIWDERYSIACRDICRFHHERYDGNGYPDGLAGDEIPISAQIVSIADVYDALTSERVYKTAIDRNKSFQMIINGECGVFNPKLLESFRNAREKLEELEEHFHETDDGE